MDQSTVKSLGRNLLIEDYPSPGQFTEAALLLLPTDLKVAITCSGRRHLNHIGEDPINFTLLFCKQIKAKS